MAARLIDAVRSACRALEGYWVMGDAKSASRLNTIADELSHLEAELEAAEGLAAFRCENCAEGKHDRCHGHVEYACECTHE